MAAMETAAVKGYIVLPMAVLMAIHKSQLRVTHW